MTREEAIIILDCERPYGNCGCGASIEEIEDALNMAIQALEREPRCKECKWWKDSDGKYRRGIGAESQCPINSHTVYCGDGYCYMFSPKEERRIGNKDGEVNN